MLAETFVVAWRRFEDVPSGEDARLWLYGVARRILSNHQRGVRRRALLAERLKTEFAREMPAQSAPEVGETALMEALQDLDKNDQEMLLLAGWEELEPAQIARVLGRALAGEWRRRLYL